ncbi:bifunctional diaminohydroxyphosphoribosylaminopyrimidine deaminase/5-amino-6-(5-phosphoribosylamino)uracil reductase RibD [Flavobacterium sediminis]|uniref:Riboflavin biosynthesis protein RibD n=1 Tax=Flavobacterium sediminis TaxID=2201181 RepID=A0A2U8QRW2_9FLAO|nr:bifunctional diaminohydroxyphosphoribosylaminopyrimidine deaminase/5-amino-6-(5-phosphoribosylamino)uracil reductase RibD [Flavobacterium sediminis]AWM12900.1 bifunctional diaminohydroxyphosphoribosylaminopyrimidine deaminase/5-amino-6-(5-phosphoribosylamino)uracil reductase RibD [Flavobacterium sediminis]
MTTHEKYMHRALQLAKNGLGTTYPNPMVGSVIVHHGKIIGEGWHKRSGEPHAEVNAVNSVKDKSLLKEATIYVTLEPCSHFGKTPPCCDLIIAKEIPNVVVGTIDPFAKVAGTGIQKLKEAGKNVTVGVLEKECKELNKRFFTFHEKKRPYIILKWAESNDGFIAPLTKDSNRPVWITNQYSRQLVHKWRTEEQSILVGTQTVLDDNPVLNARDFFGNNPTRIILDRQGKIPESSAVKNGIQKSIIYSDTIFLTKNNTISHKKAIFDTHFLDFLVSDLHQEGLQSIIIEGGAKTLQSFIDKDLWDEARVFIGNISLKNGITAPKIHRFPISIENVQGNQLKQYKNYD